MKTETILFVLPFFPYPLETGGHQAIFNGIRAVADKYNIILTYCADDTPQYRSAEKQLLERLPDIVLSPVLHKQEDLKTIQKLYLRIKSVAKRLFGVKQIVAENHYYNWWRSEIAPLPDNLSCHIAELLRQNNIDVVQAEMISMASTIFLVPSNIKTVFVHHELTFVRHSLEMEQYGADDTAKAMYQYAKMIEIDMLNKYDTVITLSETDKEKLQEAGVKSNIATSFAIVDESHYHPQVESKKILTFIGGDIHTPNLAGIEWFLDNCWNLLKTKDSEYKLKIISRWSEKNVNRIAEKYADVEFLGYVDDLDSVLEGATMIVPITIGSGIRMKILESASRGVPFVSTTVGAEGLPFADGENCYIKDTPDDFMNAIIALQDPNVRTSFIEKAKEVVSARFSFVAFKKNRIMAYS